MFVITNSACSSLSLPDFSAILAAKSIKIEKMVNARCGLKPHTGRCNEHGHGPFGMENTAMRYFPIFVDLQNARVVVVGGGEEGLRKIRLLLKTDAKIDVIATTLHDELKANPRVNWLATHYSAKLLEGAALVYSSDPVLNAQVSADAKALGIQINAVDDAEISTFIVPSIVDRAPVVVAIGTEGTAPVLGQGIRAKIDAMLPDKLGALAAHAQTLRERVARHIPHGNRRRAFWQQFFFGAPRDAFIAGDDLNFHTTVHDAVKDALSGDTGRVSLVGAGPGDPELLTLKAQRKLMEADVIIYDRLVSAEVLEMARRDAVRIPVGKTPFAPSPKQSEINEIIITEAKKGLRVVRLKGGDPYVFGRGGEEQAALEAAGIPVDVVPGITAALGCAASLKTPLTQRGQNRSITLLTASSETGIADQNWQALAKPGQVLAIYMGIHAAGTISAQLLDAGMSPSTPVTLVENGTRRDERVLNTTIGTLWDAVQRAGIQGPALIYVGLNAAKSSADVVPFPIREDIQQAALRAVS
jgi:uroporphyrin-III C-methyltransferase / precorrin-2 dehydrogenase / sirohydrochlorin ferrochelatase